MFAASQPQNKINTAKWIIEIRFDIREGITDKFQEHANEEGPEYTPRHDDLVET